MSEFPISPVELNMGFDKSVEEFEKELSNDDVEITNLAKQRGWEILKRAIENAIKSLEDVNVVEVDTPATIGYKYMASLVAKKYLRSIIEYVEETERTAEDGS
jgi:hypothetical protein